MFNLRGNAAVYRPNGRLRREVDALDTLLAAVGTSEESPSGLVTTKTSWCSDHIGYELTTEYKLKRRRQRDVMQRVGSEIFSVIKQGETIKTAAHYALKSVLYFSSRSKAFADYTARQFYTRCPQTLLKSDMTPQEQFATLYIPVVAVMNSLEQDLSGEALPRWETYDFIRTALQAGAAALHLDNREIPAPVYPIIS